MTHRIGWIDTLKAIGLYLVFLGHMKWANRELVVYIYSFHIPLFFFLAGLMFKDKSLESGFLKLLKSKILSRLVPYAGFGLLSYVAWVGLQLLREADVTGFRLFRPLVGMFYGNGNDGWLEHNVLLWFLACLFTTELLFFAMRKRIHGKMGFIALLACCAIAGFYSSFSPLPRLPFGLDVSMTALVFYGSGHVLREWVLKGKAHPLGILLTGLAGLVFALWNGRVDMNGNTYGNIGLYYAAASTNIFFWIEVAKRVPQLAQVNFIGQNTLPLFLLQSLSYLVLHTCALLIFPGLKTLGINTLFAMCFSAISLVLLLPAVMFINWKLPWLLGNMHRAHPDRARTSS